jgi:hypothetical protein
VVESCSGSSTEDADVVWKGLSKGSQREHFEKHRVEFGKNTSNRHIELANAFASVKGALREAEGGHIQI